MALEGIKSTLISSSSFSLSSSSSLNREELPYLGGLRSGVVGRGVEEEEEGEVETGTDNDKYSVASLLFDLV